MRDRRGPRRGQGNIWCGSTYLEHCEYTIGSSRLVRGGGAGPFRIYSFPNKPTLASAEHMGGEQLMEEMSQVQHCAAVFGLLQSEALSTRESRDLIRKTKEELDDNEA